MDINTKILKKNAFRVTKERGMTASRIRVPGGHLDAKYLSQIQHIAETFGNGTVHITSRQGFEIPGIPFEKMPEVNAALQSLITVWRSIRMKWAAAILLLEPEISPLAWATVSVHSPVMIPLRLPSVLKKLFSPTISTLRLL